MSRIFRMNLIFLLVSISVGQTLPTGSTSVFEGSGGCATCHTQGGPNTSALQDQNGNDVSPATYWRSSMMANSVKDPLWQAKVKAEIESNPHLQAVIEDKCTSCHAPMGNTQAAYNGQEDYTFSEMLIDPLAKDGVSCSVCHQIQDPQQGGGDSFSGHFDIDDSRTIFGPFTNPVTGPMMNMVNYTPSFSPHIGESEMCATCHTLFTPYVNDAGEVVGEAPEQVPYLEWLNSDYPDAGIECQTCHMPTRDENITLSNRPQWLGSRNPLHAHEFVGGNIFMLKLMQQFGTELGVTASSTHFDSTISRTLRLLQTHTATLDIQANWSAISDTLEIEVEVENLSGHKFPTAYPSRRAWLELCIENSVGDTVFHSGAWNQDGEIAGLDAGYEPHHQIIRSEDQVQIYQNIARDVNGEKTYTLLRIAGYLKDNRIPPMGYLSTGIAADSTSIEGLAALDTDFNRNGLEEGTGRDIVHFMLGGLNPGIEYTITANLNYQTIAPRFVEDLFSYDLPEVTAFQSYYDQMDLSPVSITSITQSLSAVSVEPIRPESNLVLEHFPNPFNPVTHFRIAVPDKGSIKIVIFNLQGQLVREMSHLSTSAGHIKMSWDARELNGKDLDAGVYIANIEFINASSNQVSRQGVKLVYLK